MLLYVIHNVKRRDDMSIFSIGSSHPNTNPNQTLNPNSAADAKID